MTFLNRITSIYRLKYLPSNSKIYYRIVQKRYCYSIFGIQDLVQREKLDTFSILPVRSVNHEIAIEIAKRYFLSENVFVRSRNMNLNDDHAIEEYLTGLLRQGNSLFAKAPDGTIAGLCINFAASPVDLQNLRNYAFYRQDRNTKDFLYFTAKLQETPNLWTIFKEDKVFEIKMLAVIPKYRRQGLAVMLAQKSTTQAYDQGYKIVRMDCINPYEISIKSFDDLLAFINDELVADKNSVRYCISPQEKLIITLSYKIAERCMLSCVVKFPLHKLRGATAPFIKQNSAYNACVRVYVDASVKHDYPNLNQTDFESMFE